MPWNWGRKEPSAPAVPTPGTPLPSEPGTPDFLRATVPSAASGPAGTRYHVKDVYTITGIGVVLVGSLEAGELRVDGTVSVIDGSTGAVRVPSATIKEMLYHRHPVTTLGVGMEAGIVLHRPTGVPGRGVSLTKAEVRKGDFLVPT